MYASGGIIAAFPYTGPTPVPQSVIVMQSCVTAWLSTSYAAPPIGACDNGLKGTQTSTGPSPGPQGYSASGTCGNDSSGNPLVVYSVVAGASPLVLPTVTVKANVAGDATSAQLKASASYTATVSPVIIAPIGATSDGRGGWDILVGQECSPDLEGIPASCTVSNYRWTVTGTTMQSWTVSSDFTHTTEVDGSGLLNVANPKWFWNDKSQASETITCTATVTPPTGQGAPFSVTATQAVGVYLPNWSARGFGGKMTVDVNEPSSNGTDFWLHASPASGQPGGMTWLANLAPPQNTPVTFDKGNIYLVQTIIPDVKYINSANQQYEDICQGQLGVDTSWPYGGEWAIYEDDPYQPNYQSNDTPGTDLTALNAIYGSQMSSFEDYIMYQPPDSPEYVPLGSFKWNVNGTATIPSTNNWADFRNPSGIIEPSGGPSPFTPSNAYPSWTQNSGNQPNGTPAFKPF